MLSVDKDTSRAARTRSSLVRLFQPSSKLARLGKACGTLLALGVGDADGEGAGLGDASGSSLGSGRDGLADASGGADADAGRADGEATVAMVVSHCLSTSAWKSGMLWSRLKFALMVVSLLCGVAAAHQTNEQRTSREGERASAALARDGHSVLPGLTMCAMQTGSSSSQFMSTRSSRSSCSWHSSWGR